MGKPDFSNLTIEDIAADPHKFGAPSFKEFCAGKYRKPSQDEQDKLALLDNGPKKIRKQMRKQFWVVGKYKCETAEQAEKVAASENIDLRFYSPQLVDVGNHKCDLYLIFSTYKEVRGKIIRG